MAREYRDWAPYVPVAERRKKAEREMAKLRKKGHPVAPVRIEGRTIATTFWGKAWCDNLESYRDYENRLPRGRTYVRNGSVVDLQIAPLQVKAMVSGITINQTLPPMRPLRGLRGGRSQSASRTVDQRSVRCSRPMRIATRTNCQIKPTVRHTISAFIIGTSPSPAKRSATAGATSQARAAIGSAAAAQTPKIPGIRSCGISTLETTASPRAVAVCGTEMLICILLCFKTRFLDARSRLR